MLYGGDGACAGEPDESSLSDLYDAALLRCPDQLRAYIERKLKIGDAPLPFGFFAGFFSFLKFHHRDFPLFLHDGLRRLLNDALGRKNAANHDAIQPHGDVLLLNQFDLHFPGNGFLEFRTGGGIEDGHRCRRGSFEPVIDGRAGSCRAGGG